MDPFVALVVVAVLVVAATLVGWLWKSRQGRVVAVDGDAASRDATDFAEFGVTDTARTTFLQFSTEFCTYCPATRRVLGSLANDVDGVAFVEYDLTHDPETARRLHITQTPTVFVIGADGALASRAGGAPKLADLRALLNERGHAVAGAASRESAPSTSPLPS